MKQYIVNTGIARSGTSCMMGALREAGVPIAGHRFPIVIGHRDHGKINAGAEREHAIHIYGRNMDNMERLNKEETNRKS